MRYATIFLLFSLAMDALPESGPATRPVSLKEFKYVVHVSSLHGKNQPQGGTKNRPWKTLAYAVEHLPIFQSPARTAILVSQGEYPLASLHLPDNLALYGGFSDDFQKRDIFQYPSILDGQGKDRLVIAANGTTIDGFYIQNGQVRGKGGAVFCEAIACTLRNNIFRNNRTLSPRPWQPRYRHEIANDGGAIYCQKGAIPVIENNLFVNNTTEIGRGGAVALHGLCKGIIRNNVFINNVTGTSDPKRSSDGGAVSVFDWSSPVIENNIFLENQALNKNDGGALFVALWSSPIIRKNIFVGNRCDDDGGALFVGGQEHRYDRPFDKMPPAEQFFVEISENVFIGNANPSVNSGAMRMTMETRGRFQGNVCAFNTGIYFQRSEVEIAENVILDDFLCIETREWLLPYRIHHNWFLGKFILTTAAMLENNWIKTAQTQINAQTEIPRFVNDRLVLPVWSSNQHPQQGTTTLFVPEKVLKQNELRGRIVRAGNAWGVVKSNDAYFIEIWGLVSEAMEIVVLPSYRIKQ